MRRGSKSTHSLAARALIWQRIRQDGGGCLANVPTQADTSSLRRLDPNCLSSDGLLWGYLPLSALGRTSLARCTGRPCLRRRTWTLASSHGGARHGTQGASRGLPPWHGRAPSRSGRTMPRNPARRVGALEGARVSPAGEGAVPYTWQNMCSAGGVQRATRWIAQGLRCLVLWRHNANPVCPEPWRPWPGRPFSPARAPSGPARVPGFSCAAGQA